MGPRPVRAAGGPTGLHFPFRGRVTPDCCVENIEACRAFSQHVIYRKIPKSFFEIGGGSRLFTRLNRVSFHEPEILVFGGLEPECGGPFCRLVEGDEPPVDRAAVEGL